MIKITLNTKITLDMLKKKIDSIYILDWFIEQKLENCSFVELIDRMVEEKGGYLNFLFDNFNICSNLLDILSNNKDSNVRYSVASHKNTSLKVLKQLSNDSDYWVRGKVAQNEKTDTDTLEFLSTDKNSNVKSGVAENEKTSLETLDILSKDSCYYVRWYVAENKKTSIETLDFLSRDKNSNVKRDAIKNLESRKK